MAGKCDLILFDLKTVEEDVAQKYFQRSVTHPLGLLRRLVKAKNDMVIRFAMIPGVNDSIASIESYCSVLAELCPHYPIELLPFHRLGSSKYHAVNRSYDFENTALLTKEQLDKAVTVFQNHNLSIKVLN
jgi:pyruvate formate lyase activating enzyme